MGERENLSKMTPRFCAEVEGRIASSPMRKEGGEMVEMFLDWRHRNSVLESLSFRLFRGIHLRMSSIQASSLAKVAVYSVGDLGSPRGRV